MAQGRWHHGRLAAGFAGQNYGVAATACRGSPRDGTRTRRAELVDKMRKHAVELDNDPNVSEFFPTYRGGDWRYPVLRIGRPHDQALSLGGLLSDCAEYLADDSSFVGTFGLLESRRPNTLKSFVIKGVFRWIDFYLAQGRELKIVTAKQPRMVETALLAGAVLDIDVTENNVTQVRIEERRKYAHD